MYLGYNMISMTTLVYQKAEERLFHVLHLKSNEYTPPRASEISEKNWSTKARPFLTSDLP